MSPTLPPKLPGDSSSLHAVDDGSAKEKSVEQLSPAPEYPKGVEALAIMAALVLSITLCSLDQVSSTTPRFS